MEQITVYYITTGGRTFVIPEREDIEYYKKLYRAKADDLGVQCELEASSETPNQDRIRSLKLEQKLYLDLEDANKRLEKQRVELLSRTEEVKEKVFEWTEPNWGMVSQLNSKHRTLVGDRHIVDQMMVNFDLLQKCVPDVAKAHPAFAEFFLGRIRRYTEVNTAELPFI